VYTCWSVGRCWCTGKTRGPARALRLTHTKPVLKSHWPLSHDGVHHCLCFEWSYITDQTVYVTILDLDVDGSTVYKSCGDLDWDSTAHGWVLLASGYGTGISTLREPKAPSVHRYLWHVVYLTRVPKGTRGSLCDNYTELAHEVRHCVWLRLLFPLGLHQYTWVLYPYIWCSLGVLERLSPGTPWDYPRYTDPLVDLGVVLRDP